MAQRNADDSFPTFRDHHFLSKNLRTNRLVRGTTSQKGADICIFFIVCSVIVLFLETALVTMYLTRLPLTVRKNLHRGKSGESDGSSRSSVLMLWCVCMVKQMPSSFSIKWKVSVWIMNYAVRIHLCRLVCNEDI